MPLTDLDRKLLSDLLSGQSGSWKQFVDRFSSLILHVIRHTAQAHSLRLNDDDIEDLCADTLAELLMRDMAALRAFRGRCSLATYLGVIARRIVVRKLAEHRFNNALGHISAHQAAVEYASGEPPVARTAEQRDQVEQLFRKLPENSRRLLRWAFLDGLSYREIAARLGRPVNSIGPLIHRVRNIAAQLVSSAGQETSR